MSSPYSSAAVSGAMDGLGMEGEVKSGGGTVEDERTLLTKAAAWWAAWRE